MNRRTLKKLCHRAKAKLIAEHGFTESDFAASDGSETTAAPVTMERRFVEHGSYLTPLKGTPVMWRRVSYEYDEWDVFLPTEVLAQYTEDWSDYGKEPADEARDAA